MFDTFDSEASEILNEIGDIFADEFDTPVTILTASSDDGIIAGQLMSGGDIYNYASDGHDIGYDYAEDDSEEFHEYTRGFLESGYGINADSMENPAEYALGFLRLDAQVKCKKGGVPCGKICLPKGAKCKKYGSSGNASAMKGVAGKLKSPGKVAAGIAVGGIGAAALAGGAGYLAYKNRDKLGEPGRRLGVIGTRVKAAAREGKEEFMSGVNNAKEILKAGQKTSKGISDLPGDEGLTRKEKYKANQMRKSLAAGAAGGGAAGAVGAVAAGTENAIDAIRYNLTRNPKFASGGSGEGSGSGNKALPPGGKDGDIVRSRRRTQGGGVNLGRGITIDPTALPSGRRGGDITRSERGAISLGRKNMEAKLEDRESKQLSGSSENRRTLSGRPENRRAALPPSSRVERKLLKGREQRALPPAQEESFPVRETAAAIAATTNAAAAAKKKKKNEPSGFTKRLVEKSRKNKR